jgi:hypothetical protein
MIITYKIDAVHDILKRVIKVGLTEKEANELHLELSENGYENDNIEVDIHEVIYEVGDQISVDEQMFNDLPTTEQLDNIKGRNATVEELYQRDARETIRFIFDGSPKFPLTGTIEAKRIDNAHGQLIVKWDNVPDDNQWKKTNTYFLEYMGFKFQEENFPFIPIEESDDDLLNDNNRLLKYLMKQNGLTQEEAELYLKPVYRAMEKAEVVFYRP